MLLYLSCIQIFLMAFIYLIPLASTSTIISSTIATGFFLVSGYTLHLKDIPWYLKWVQQVSPTGWLMPFLLNRELSPGALKSTSSPPLCNMQVNVSNWCTLWDIHWFLILFRRSNTRKSLFSCRVHQPTVQTYWGILDTWNRKI